MAANRASYILLVVLKVKLASLFLMSRTVVVRLLLACIRLSACPPRVVLPYVVVHNRLLPVWT